MYGLLRPWNCLGKNTGVGSHFLLQGIFLTQGSNSCFLHCGQIIYHQATREILMYGLRLINTSLSPLVLKSSDVD